MQKMDDKELKACQVDILNYFVKKCEEYQLRYYLFGGTLLGAARHKGFIPWDDDIDVALPREDYDLFIKKIAEENTGRYVVKSIELANTYYPFAKMEDTWTKITNSHSTLHNGVWIDIFPLDKVESNEKLQHMYKKIGRYGVMLEQAEIKIGTGRNPIVAFAKIPIVLYAKAKGAKYWSNKITELALSGKNTDSGLLADVVWGAGPALNAEKFLEVGYLSFEGRQYCVPANWKDVLGWWYGEDYMQLPPMKMRVNHGTEAIYTKEVTK